MISLITHTFPITLFPLLQHIPVIMGIHKKIFSSGSENVVRGLLNSPAVQVIDFICNPFLVKSGLTNLGNSKCVLCNLILKAGTLLIYKSIKMIGYWVFNTQENIRTQYCI